MNNSLKLSVNDQYVFEMSESNLNELDAVPTEKNKFHILKGNSSFNATVLNSDFIQKKYTIIVNNNKYTVSISNALDLLIASMGLEVGTSKHINVVKAPMPGLILEISVEVGQSVKENDNLIILSAMKMENSFLSPRDGVIKSIAVKVGDAVDKGQLMIEFE